MVKRRPESFEPPLVNRRRWGERDALTAYPSPPVFLQRGAHRTMSETKLVLDLVGHLGAPVVAPPLRLVVPEVFEAERGHVPSVAVCGCGVDHVPHRVLTHSLRAVAGVNVAELVIARDFRRAVVVLVRELVGVQVARGHAAVAARGLLPVGDELLGGLARGLAGGDDAAPLEVVSDELVYGRIELPLIASGGVPHDDEGSSALVFLGGGAVGVGGRASSEEGATDDCDDDKHQNCNRTVIHEAILQRRRDAVSSVFYHTPSSLSSPLFYPF